MSERDIAPHARITLTKSGVPAQSFDPETGNCSLEGVDGRARTCPNNPSRNAYPYLPDICAECPVNPSVAASTREKLPSVYVPRRPRRYSSPEKKV